MYFLDLLAESKLEEKWKIKQIKGFEPNKLRDGSIESI